MKVLLVAHHLPPRHLAGTEVYTTRLAAALGRDHDVTVFATDDDPGLRPGTIRRRRGDRCDIVELAVPRLVRKPEDSWSSRHAEDAFQEILGSLRPDVCHFQHLRFLSLALPALAAAAGVPTLMTVHDYWLLCARDGHLVDRDGGWCQGPEPERCAACLADYRFGLSPAELFGSRVVAKLSGTFGIDLRGAARRLGVALRRTRRGREAEPVLSRPGAAGMLAIVEARRAAASAATLAIGTFISPSEFLRGAFRRAGFGGRWVVMGHGVDGPKLRPAAIPRGSGPLRIGFAGTVTPLKGVDVLIRAAKKLDAGSYRLEIHGRDDLRPEYAEPLKREAAGLPIHFHGAFTPSDAASFIPGWDVAVVPSRWVENQPLSILEAFACGVPVVAADLGGMPEFVKEGVNGRLFEPDDADALHTVLRELADDRGALERLRGGVVAPPTLDDHAGRIAALYAEARASG